MTKIKIWQCEDCGEVGTLVSSKKAEEYLVFTCYCDNCYKYFDVQINESEFFNIFKKN